MSDLFHEKMEIAFLDEIMQIIWQTLHHQYQILTKRPYRMFEYFEGEIYSKKFTSNRKIFGGGITHHIPPNVWLGTTTESSRVK